jgi:5-methyltetrahydropteroyltriglutamate--homocysteine methyltransferase
MALGRTQPPFRADHVGSLLRPPELLRAREEVEAGRLSAEELRAAEDDAIRAAVRMQEDVGLQSATDGEFRRRSWLEDFIFQLGGVAPAGSSQAARASAAQTPGRIDLGTAGSATLLRVEDRVHLSHTIFAEDFEALAAMTTTAIPKVTIPSPSMVHYRGGRAAIDENVYPDLDEFWSDLSAAYAAEIRGLAELGCTYLQLDDTSLAYMNDPEQREHVARIGGDPERQHLTYIRQLNAALAGRPEHMTVTTHLCRGNLRSSWMAEGGYGFVAEPLFSELQVDGFFLEYDDERSGGFEPLRFVPKGKLVVLGLVTSKFGELEDKDLLKRRIEEASRFVDLEQLCLSPQCGFASVLEGNQLSYEQQVAKLRLVVETAREVWG